ncbi:hypothetical protein BDW74DRAFT_115313 [Aspergillus multicolor]|uniref:uncharacterized protein n=1 Tax=Aspergillus multicolor TaxID=41759 RepID=UPI003CCE25AC
MASVKVNDTLVSTAEAEPSSSRDFTFKTAKRTGKDAGVITDEAENEINREEVLTALNADEEKRLIRRVDWRLVPILTMLYLVKKIDENNASNARIMNKGTYRNIMTQLGVTSDDYGMITVLYTVPYIVAETPFTLLVKKVRPSRWQSRIMLSWGVVTACTAAVTNRAGLYAVRFMLGVTEASMYPTIVLHLTYWYRPDEIAVRMVWVYVVGNTAGIIGGLLAYAFHNISGAGNISGWQWLFIVEGAATVLLSFVVFVFLPDFPATAKWLSPTERAFLQTRLPENSPRAAEKDFDVKEIITSLRDRRLWLFTLMSALITSGSSGVKFYQPTIIANMGFSDIATAQILNIPMSVLAIIFIILCGYGSDRYPQIPLPVFHIVCTAVIIACYSVLVAYPNDIGVYIAMMIGNAAAGAHVPIKWAWRAQTMTGATGSAFAIAFVGSCGQTGDAIGPQMFKESYSPRYQLPFGLSMGLIALCGLVIGYTWWVTRQTERDTRMHKIARRKAKRKNETVLDDVSDHDLERRLV